jgi:inorganic pyrophosphatase
MRAKVIGVMRMVDGGEKDDKIIAVSPDDMSINHIDCIEDLPTHLLRELRAFFEDYKKLEHKTVDVEDFQSKDVAHQIIMKALEDYKIYMQD